MLKLPLGVGVCFLGGFGVMEDLPEDQEKVEFLPTTLPAHPGDSAINQGDGVSTGQPTSRPRTPPQNEGLIRALFMGEVC